ncbi:MAG: SDR family NAD(P)-dependent oxidoreductase [Caldilineaceae bacterium]|nr:SDR family NAD(P)-dependent oxidoreductase [Caldilineaceae bacterium]
MKQALIWGGDGDIGQTLAGQLLDAGWRVAVTIHNDAETDHRLAAAVQADVADDYSIRQAVLALNGEIDTVDLWVYAVGDIAFTKVADLSPTDWSRILNANLNGAYLALHHSLPLLAVDAHLIFIGALTEQLQLPRLAAYVSAKAGLEALVAVLAKEERKRKVTLIRPGAVDTKFWQRGPATLPKAHLKPGDVANSIFTIYHEGRTGQIDLLPKQG